MSADGDFMRDCARIAADLQEAVHDPDNFGELVEIFQRAANNVRRANAFREAWLDGSDPWPADAWAREHVNLDDHGDDVQS